MPYLLRSSGFFARNAIVGETFFGGRMRSVAGIAHSTTYASRLAGV
jgi:hypothetical protein